MTAAAEYEKNLQERGADCLNALRGKTFSVAGREFGYLIYEVHRVSWAVTAGRDRIEVWDVNRQRVLLDPPSAREYLRAAYEMATEVWARPLHEG